MARKRCNELLTRIYIFLSVIFSVPLKLDLPFVTRTFKCGSSFTKGPGTNAKSRVYHNYVKGKEVWVEGRGKKYDRAYNHAENIWCHLVDVLELILPNSYNGPQWGKFFLSRNWKNKKHRILDTYLKNIWAKFGCSKSRNKNFKTRGILHIKSI